jgi:hypothetical protein
MLNATMANLPLSDDAPSRGAAGGIVDAKQLLRP